MSSLPQGWHGLPVASKSSTISETSTVPIAIRKKWNSPLSSEVPPSKLPSYRPSTVRLQRSSINNTLHTRSTSKFTNSQIETSDPTKSLLIKELKNEISKLKKEITTLKTENSILKVKVRRVDDENIQKSKQIEKLRVELKCAQKNETSGCKKTKESELLLLRQKCLRLEGALKEKDLVVKKLTNETIKTVEMVNNTHTTLKQSGDSEQSQLLLCDGKSAKRSTLNVRTNISRANQSSKGEVIKLRDMIHKLEKENQDFQQQVKEQCEEIRRLKLHLRSHTYIKPHSEISVSKSSAKPSSSVTHSKSSLFSSNKLQGINSKENIKSSSSVAQSRVFVTQKTAKKVSGIRENQVKRLNVKKNLPNSTNVPERNTNNKQIRERISKMCVTKSDSTFIKLTCPQATSSVSKHPNSLENNIEDQVKQMRENIAANKIQRSWRNHKEQIAQSKEPEYVDKAMTFIVTSLKYHKMRKEKLNFVGKQKHIIPKLKDEKESAIVEAIRAVTKKLWEKEVTANLNN